MCRSRVTNAKGLIAAFVVAVACAGCAAVDHFEPRALQFNQEASNTKSNTILLNILRAARRLPLQFTEYTTTVGQSSVSGQLSASLPVATIPSNIARTFSLNPQLQGTAQNQVTIQNLNTQEFYNGLQTPLTLPMLASFMAVGYDPHMIFMLAVSSLRRTQGIAIDELKNDPSDWRQINQFYDVIKLLVLAGLNFETTQSPARGIGPELTADEAKALLPHYISATATAAAANATAAMPDFTQRKGNRYQLTKSKTLFRICFQQPKLRQARSIAIHPDLHVQDLGGNNYRIHLVLSRSGPNNRFSMTVLQSRLCGAPPDPTPTSPIVDWTFELRSVEAIYNYLGGIVRTGWLDPTLFENTYQFPRDRGGMPFFLFKVHEGLAGGAVVAAHLGATYSILPTDEYDRDKSTQVISLLTDLWALESSAKTFPSSNTVTVTTQ